MIINPEKILELGLVKGRIKKDQIQQNGIDLRIEKVFELESDLVLTKKDRKISKVSTVYPGTDKLFRIYAQRAYLIETKEFITIPKDMCALIIQRSSLNRSGIQILSSWYDSGFENFGGATMYPFRNAVIEKGSKVVQIIYFAAESASTYKGIYNYAE